MQCFACLGGFSFYAFFPPDSSLSMGETEGYVKLTAEEIAVKGSQHFSFSLPLFFPLHRQCCWPLVGIWILKRHFIHLSCSYSQGKGGKSCTVFLFYPPLSSDLQKKPGQAFIFPPHASFSLVSHTYFVLCCKLHQQTAKLRHTAESVESIFSRF